MVNHVTNTGSGNSTSNSSKSACLSGSVQYNGYNPSAGRTQMLQTFTYQGTNANTAHFEFGASRNNNYGFHRDENHLLNGLNVLG